MPKRKLVTPDTTERDWLRKNVPTHTLTRWKKRKINRTLTDIGKHTTQQHESDDDASQREEQRAEPLTLAQENNEDASQRQEQRAESFTMVQDNVPQEIDDVHSHGLTEGQSIISILSFALRHNTTGVLMEDLLKLLKLHSAGTSAKK